MKLILFIFIFIAATAHADIVTPPYTVSCIPPLIWRTNHCECPNGETPIYTSYGTAICSKPIVQPPQHMCVVTITYAANTPATPILTASRDTECDEAGLKLAIAIALAERLGLQP